MHRIIDKCNRIVVVPKVLYFVTANPESITRSKVSIKRLDDIEALYDRVHFFEEKNLHEFLPPTADMMIWAYTGLRPQIVDCSPQARKRYQEIKGMMRYTYYKYSKNQKFEEILCIEGVNLYRWLTSLRIRNRIKILLNRKNR